MIKSVVNSIPNNKILGWSKLKADNKINVTKKLKLAFGKIENIVGKGAFSIPTMFSKGFFITVIKSQDCVVKSKPFPIQALSFTCLL